MLSSALLIAEDKVQLVQSIIIVDGNHTDREPERFGWQISDVAAGLGIGSSDQRLFARLGCSAPRGSRH